MSANLALFLALAMVPVIGVLYHKGYLSAPEPEVRTYTLSARWGREVMKGMYLYLPKEDRVALITGWEQMSGDSARISYEGGEIVLYDNEVVEIATPTS